MTRARITAGTLSALILLTCWVCWQTGIVHAAPWRPSPIPEPSGPHPVGRSDTRIGDGPAVSIWYPSTGGVPASYIPASNLVAEWQVANASAAWLHTPQAAMAMVGAAAPASQDAPLDGDRLPVVIMSPGLGTPRWILSGLAADLASHGRVVVVMDHLGESPAVDTADGVVLGTPPNPDDPVYMRARLDARVADTRLVLDRLDALPVVGGHVDLTRVTMVGHSYGGYTAVAAMSSDPRITSAVVLDGSAGWIGTTGLEETGVDRPVLLVTYGELIHNSWLRFARNTPGPFTMASVRGGGHYTPTDLPSLAPPAVELCGTIPAGRGTDLSRRIVQDYLEGQPAGLWPEVAWR
ncbi:alpha/beta hydrolase family protein [Nocardia wallacei]|uniref:alpha/beta hydrolase family protein n=1 Tax=Nocardia wallacei TaxID=480035 RepID=UPI0024551E0F|nr:hypothetical protein [Nocardia wallacei]